MAAAAASDGDDCAQWREQRRGRPFGEEREVQGSEVGSSRCRLASTEAGRQVAWQHGRARASGTRSASDWRGGDDDWQLGQWAALLGWVSGQVSSLSLFLILFVFYFFCKFVALLKIARHL